MLLILRGILYGLWFLLSCGVIGHGFLCALNSSKNSKPSPEVLALGFAVWLGVSEAFTLWFVAFHGSKTAFCLVLLVIYILLMANGLRFFGRLKFDFKKFVDSYFPAILITLLIILLLIIFCRTDEDDSFYVSTAALIQNSSIVNPYDASFGIPGLGTVFMYDFEIWESFVGVSSQLFGLPAVASMHTFLLPSLLVLSTSGFLALGQALFKDEKKASVFYLLICIFHLFGGYSTMSQGSFLLSRLWQGKSAFLNILLPLMIGTILSFGEENLADSIQKERSPKALEPKDSLKFILSITLIILVGCALNPTSYYVLGFALVLVSISAAILYKKPSILVPIIPSLGIIGGLTYMMLVRSREFPAQMSAASMATETFVYDTFISFFGGGRGLLYILFFMAAFVYSIFRGNKEAKVYFVFFPVFLFILILNPFMGKIIAENVTMTPSFWRVFWLLPIGPAISYFSVSLFYELDKKALKASALILGIIFLILPGDFMFTKDNDFFIPKNIERIPEDSITFGNAMMGEGILLAPTKISTSIREKYTDIQVIFSRHQYISDLFTFRGKEKEGKDRLSLYNFASGFTEDYTGIDSLLKEYGVYYIALYNYSDKEASYISSLGYEPLCFGEELTLYVFSP